MQFNPTVARSSQNGESGIGVQKRYKDEKAATGSGRWVPKEVLDAAAAGMVDSLKQLRDQSLVSNIAVVDRESASGASAGMGGGSAGGSGDGGGGGRPLARISDRHVCPMVTSVLPHVGGPIALGCPTVLVGNLPAARRQHCTWRHDRDRISDRPCR